MSSEKISSQLEHHWALDSQAAEVLGDRIESTHQTDLIESIVENLDPHAVAKRDQHRQEIGRIFQHESDKGLVVLGPCSLDDLTDYEPLFDYIDQLQEENPEDVFALRLNGAKPRTSGGWTGLWYSTDPAERQKIFDTYTKAFERGIPILTEITQSTQLGSLGPMLSGAWLGARDMASTSLRTIASAYHLPIGVKNGVEGDVETLANSLKAIRSNTDQNDGSGVDLGTIASNHISLGIPSGILPVGEGNKTVSIIARGHNLPAGLTTEERRTAALGYLSTMCSLGVQLGSAVLIDGTHSVPPMFDIDRKDPDRLIPVLEEFNRAIHENHLDDSEQLVGVIAEIGPNIGKTDPNYVIDEPRRQQLAQVIGATVRLLSSAHHLDS